MRKLRLVLVVVVRPDFNIHGLVTIVSEYCFAFLIRTDKFLTVYFWQRHLLHAFPIVCLYFKIALFTCTFR